MKKHVAWLVGVLVFASAVNGFSAPTQNGVYEVRLEPTLDLEDVEANEGIPMHASFGMYLNQNIQLGAGATLAKKDVDSYWGKTDVWGLNLYGEINVDWDLPVVPYIGLSLGLLDAEGDDNTVFLTTVSPGIKVFFVETVSMSLQLNWNFADEKIYDVSVGADAMPTTWDGDDDGKQSAVAMALGIRFLFY